MLYRVETGQSIQAAIDAARPGDTILVGPGVFTESLVITGAKQGLRLVAPRLGDTVLDGSGMGDVHGVSIASCDFVTVSGFVLMGFARGGLVIEGNHCVLTGNEVSTGGGCGIWVSGTANLIYDNAVLEQGAAGVQVGSGPDNFVVGNRIHGNQGCGIEVTPESPHTLLLDNLTTGNDHGIRVAGAGSWVLGNRIQGNRVGLVVGSTHILLYGNVSLGNVQNGLIAQASGSVAVRNRVLSNGDAGATSVLNGREHTAEDPDHEPDVTFESQGVSLRSPGNSLYYANQLGYNLGPGLVAWMQQSLIVGNTVERNRDVGADLTEAAASRLLQNVVRWNDGHGVQLGPLSSDNLVDHNSACGNRDVGIRVDVTALQNLVRSNEVHGNGHWDILAEAEAAEQNAFHLNDSGKSSPGELE